MTAVAAERRYKPYGAALSLMTCQDREVLLHGPAGTGKSMACLTKLYLAAEKYPGMRGLILRKYRRSLTDAALVTWEEEVVPEGHPCLAGPKRPDRHIYYFPNGSTITVRGLDDPDKQKSSQYDLVYPQEASELNEDDLTPVMRGMRNNVMPYQQMLPDTNPDAPTHWLRARFGITDDAALVSRNGTATAFKSRHEDNPLLWDMEKGEWTPFGLSYIATLDAIPNEMDRLRLRHGIWAGAEGAVYKNFSMSDVIKPFDLPDWWPRDVGLDFGAVNTAALLYAINPDTYEKFLYREYLAGGRTAEQHAFYLRVGEPRHLKVTGGSGSEGQWRREFLAAGMLVHEPRITDVALGISRVYGMHTRHLIKVFDTCTGYLAQKADYRYKKDAAVPGEIENKHKYHFMDAERYVMSASGDTLGGGDASILDTLKRQGVFA